MSTSRSRCAWALALALCAFASRAGATPQKDAEELFRRGHALYDEGKLEEACSTLARSQALDPSVGTLGLLAACEEKRGFFGRAYVDFVETARLAHVAGDKREVYAQERAAALEAKVARIVIRVDPKGPPVRVTRAGEEVPPEMLGKEIVVDPGTFDIVATAADGRAVHVAASPWAGGRLEIDIPPFRSTAAPAALHPVEHPVARALAFATGGLGIAGIGVGAGFGVWAMKSNSASKDPATCPPTAPTCPARDRAFTAANVSTAAFTVGIAALAAGTVLFVVSRPSPGATVALGLRPGGVSVAGTF